MNNTQLHNHINDFMALIRSKRSVWTTDITRAACDIVLNDAEVMKHDLDHVDDDSFDFAWHGPDIESAIEINWEKYNVDEASRAELIELRSLLSKFASETEYGFRVIRLR